MPIPIEKLEHFKKHKIGVVQKLENGKYYFVELIIKEKRQILV